MDERHLHLGRRLRQVGGGASAETAERQAIAFMRIGAGLIAVLLSAAGATASAQTIPAEPLHDAGTSITGAFEGWFKNPDGSFSLLLGYFNRNQKQEIDIPIGPDNHIEPDGPDRGQPTHFFP